MITEVNIKNFKSVKDLTIPLGRFNVFIGANGSGKSNILEAITFAGAASANKLDNEFLFSRGVRTTVALLMKNAFDTKNAKEAIELSFKNGDSKKTQFTIDEEQGAAYTQWFVKERKEVEDLLKDKLAKERKELEDLVIEHKELEKNLAKEMKKLEDLVKETEALGKRTNRVDALIRESKEFATDLANKMRHSDATLIANTGVADIIYNDLFYNKELSEFLIYSPENHFLRRFEEENQIKPLGIKGEGVFDLLQVFADEKMGYGKATIAELENYLHVIEWYKKVSGTTYGKSYPFKKYLLVNDRYIPLTLDQNSVNEGFLFLLFYISVFICKETPSFFAIDNIEASFHPLLCEKMTKDLVELSKKHNKQALITTHNPFVLDGLDLKDPEQRLFVVRRHPDGWTLVEQIEKAPQKVKLSEAWMRGYLGGIPDTIE